MHCEMAQLHEAIMVREEELQANKLARRRAIEAAVSASWRRVDRAAVQAAFHSWRRVWGGGLPGCIQRYGLHGHGPRYGMYGHGPGYGRDTNTLASDLN